MRLHTFEDRAGDRKVFHTVAGGAKVRTGRCMTLCGRDTDGMRRAAPFRPGDARGDVHFVFGCDDCIRIITEKAEKED